MKPDYSLGYDRDGEHFGLGLSLGAPPESFSVRKHDYETGDYKETFYVPKRTCTIDHIRKIGNKFLEISLSCGHAIIVHEIGDRFRFCKNCGAKVVEE